MLAVSNPKQEMTDSLLLVQWNKKNRCFVVTRSISHIVGLLVGQLAIVKNDRLGIRTNNKKFVSWITSGLLGSLKKTPVNTPAYEHLHVRKTKMRAKRKYRTATI